jgi:hypothetical protein
MGSDVTPNGIKFQFTDKIKPIGRSQLDALAQGSDPKDVDLGVTAKSYKGRRFSFRSARFIFVSNLERRAY